MSSASLLLFLAGSCLVTKLLCPDGFVQLSCSVIFVEEFPNLVVRFKSKAVVVLHIITEISLSVHAVVHMVEGTKRPNLQYQQDAGSLLDQIDGL